MFDKKVKAVFSGFVSITVSFLVTYSHAAQAPKNTPVLAAYDSTGVKIGNVVGISYSGVPLRPIISMKSNEVTFVLEVFRNRFFGNTRDVFFQTNNCSGSAFLSDSEEPLPYVAVVSNTAYLANTSASIAFTFLGSTLHDDGSCTIGPSGPMNVLPVVQIDLSVYVPPFSVR